MPSSISDSQATPSSARSSPARPRARAEPRGVPALTIALVLLGACALLALACGAYPLSPAAIVELVWTRLRGQPQVGAAATVLFDIRGPRVLGAALVGASLAGSGAAYQGLFRNPLVSPDILGVSAGAALGAVAGILLGLSVAGIEALAFVGGLGAVGAAYAVASAIRGRDPILSLVLTGVVVGALAESGVALAKFLADPENQLPAITFWLLGSLSSFNAADLPGLAAPAVLALLAVGLLRWQLDVLTLGDEEAAALGVRVMLVRAAVVAAATLMTAAAVAVSGVVGWVGLMAPHIARLIVGPSFGRLLPMAVIVGAAFLLLVDTAARSLGPVELPLGVLTAILGAPIFLILLARSGRGSP